MRPASNLVALTASIIERLGYPNRQCALSVLQHMLGPIDASSTLRQRHSVLNNDGVPLQLCCSLSSEAAVVRVIADPCTAIRDPVARFASSSERLWQLLDRNGACSLLPAVRTTLSATLPADRALLEHGPLWLSSGLHPDRGVAMYSTLSWGPEEPESRWQRVFEWLSGVLPVTVAREGALPFLECTATPVAAAIEGRTLEDAAAKVYARAREPFALSALAAQGFLDAEMLWCAQRLLAGRELPATGILPSVAFGLADGALHGCKVDVCGHCVPHTIQEWNTLINAMCKKMNLRPIDMGALLADGLASVAFVGIARRRLGMRRLNIYLKPEPQSSVVVPGNV